MPAEVAGDAGHVPRFRSPSGVGSSMLMSWLRMRACLVSAARCAAWAAARFLALMLAWMKWMQAA